MCKENAAREGKSFVLKEFTAGRNRLEDAGAAAMSRAFRAIGTLERIELPQNGIRKEGIVELARSIGTSENLKILNLNDNTFTSAGAKAVARAIRNTNDCLEDVDFGDCLCRDGAIDIIEAIVDNHPETIQASVRLIVWANMFFQVIDLTGNELVPDQAHTIIDICAGLPNIQHLKLGLNCYGSKFKSVCNYVPSGYDSVDFVDLGDEE